MRQYNFNELSSPPTNPTYPGAPANCIVAGVVNPSCVDPVGANIFALYPLPNTNLAQNGQLGAFRAITTFPALLSRATPISLARA